MKQIFYSWENFNQDILLLISQIASSYWMPDYIVGVKRGGLIPSVKLSHILNKPLFIMTCQLRDNKRDIDVDLLEVQKIEKNKKILIVDDICDSGETFEKVSKDLREKGYEDFKFCAIYYNIRQNFLVNYRIRKIDRYKDDRWIVFPWEI